ncbi:MAG TPA: hypothetical protein VIY47_14730, partial [Ignavibacteriaceae bacterium]
TDDTTLFCTIMGNSKGYTFVLPEKITEWYWLTDSLNNKIDTIKEKFAISYGPYIFAKKGRHIMFKDLNRSNKFSRLYNLDYKEFLAPSLFSTSTDSYSEVTSLLDPDCVIFDGADSIKCYKFLQVIKRRFDNLYKVIFIEKKSLLPYRMEYYDQKGLESLLTTVFAIKCR